jgi:hypothetical protein
VGETQFGRDGRLSGASEPRSKAPGFMTWREEGRGRKRKKEKEHKRR